MAKRIRENPIYAFRRKGNALVPEMQHDLSALDGVAQGERVKLEIGQWRNHDRLRAYWAMLHEVMAATGERFTVKTLHEVIKLENGVVELVSLPSGMKVAVPGSIAFDKMTEAEMAAFFGKAEEWLARTYGYEPERRAA